MIIWIIYAIVAITCSAIALALFKEGWHFIDIQSQRDVLLDAFLKSLIIPVLLSPLLLKFIFKKKSSLDATPIVDNGVEQSFSSKGITKVANKILRTIDNKTKNYIIMMIICFFLVIVAYYLMSPYQHCVDIGKPRAWCIMNTSW